MPPSLFASSSPVVVRFIPSSNSSPIACLHQSIHHLSSFSCPHGSLAVATPLVPILTATVLVILATPIAALHSAVSSHCPESIDRAITQCDFKPSAQDSTTAARGGSRADPPPAKASGDGGENRGFATREYTPEVETSGLQGPRDGKVRRPSLSDPGCATSFS